MAITDHARARYALHQRVRHRLQTDLGTPDTSLNQKLTAWWNSDFAALRAEVKKVFKHDIPLADRDDWETFLATNRAEHARLTAEIIRLETELNARVYALFNLTPEEIAIVEESTSISMEKYEHSGKEKSMDWIGKVLQVIKLPLKYVWLLTIASGSMLFLPSSILRKLRIADFARMHGQYIGIVFLCSAILVGISITTWLWNAIVRAFHNRRFSRMRKDALNRLDPHEKAILREFFFQRKDTLRLPVDQPTVSGLLSKGVLVEVGDFGERSMACWLFSVSIDHSVKSQLTFEHFDLPEKEPTDEEREMLMNSRPAFLFEIEEHNRIFHTSWRRLSPF